MSMARVKASTVALVFVALSLLRSCSIAPESSLRMNIEVEALQLKLTNPKFSTSIGSRFGGRTTADVSYGWPFLMQPFVYASNTISTALSDMLNPEYLICGARDEKGSKNRTLDHVHDQASSTPATKKKPAATKQSMSILELKDVTSGRELPPSWPRGSGSPAGPKTNIETDSTSSTSSGVTVSLSNAEARLSNAMNKEKALLRELAKGAVDLLKGVNDKKNTFIDGDNHNGSLTASSIRRILNKKLKDAWIERAAAEELVNDAKLALAQQ